jgi:hypothetical protein
MFYAIGCHEGNKIWNIDTFFRTVIMKYKGEM